MNSPFFKCYVTEENGKKVVYSPFSDEVTAKKFGRMQMSLYKAKSFHVKKVE